MNPTLLHLVSETEADAQKQNFNLPLKKFKTVVPQQKQERMTLQLHEFSEKSSMYRKGEIDTANEQLSIVESNDNLINDVSRGQPNFESDHGGKTSTHFISQQERAVAGKLPPDLIMT